MVVDTFLLGTLLGSTPTPNIPLMSITFLDWGRGLKFDCWNRLAKTWHNINYFKNQKILVFPRSNNFVQFVSGNSSIFWPNFLLDSRNVNSFWLTLLRTQEIDGDWGNDLVFFKTILKIERCLKSREVTHISPTLIYLLQLRQI